MSSSLDTMGRHVLVLTGGWSHFRQEVVDSAAAVESALKEEGFSVTTEDVASREDLFALVSCLRKEDLNPDVIFNTIGDDFAMDGHLHAILDMLQIPYCQSGQLACALASDKPVAKMVYAKAGIPVARHVVLTRKEAMAGSIDIGLPYPVIVKPILGGNSLGARIVRMAGETLLDQDNSPYFGERILVEEFIEGQDLTVVVMGDAALEVVGIITEHEFFNYEAKYLPGGVERVIPADLPEEVRAEAQRLALLAHQSLGCRGVTRTDFRYDGSTGGRGLILLELNPQPGLTQGLCLSKATEHAGITFRKLVRWMVDHAQYDE